MAGSELGELTIQVARNTDVDNSAIALLGGLREQLDKAGTNPQALAELSRQLGESSDQLAAAVAQNTRVDGSEEASKSRSSRTSAKQQNRK